jgi:hypothetical protein
MDFVPSAEDLAHVFSLATGPAFFLGAVTAMLAIVLGRLKLVLESMDEVDKHDASGNVNSYTKHEISSLAKTDRHSREMYLSLVVGRRLRAGAFSLHDGRGSVQN